MKWLSAAMAASIAETITMPFDVTKTRLQLQNELGRSLVEGQTTPTRGMVGTALGIYRNEGFRRLYTGLTPAVLRQMLCGGIGVGLYTPVRDLLVGPEVTDIPLHLKIAAGGATGLIGQALSAPTDVVKVRLQADGRLVMLGHTARYRNTWDAFVQIPKQEGLSTLFRGNVPSLLRAAVMYGTSVATYDSGKSYALRTLKMKDNIITHMGCSTLSGLVAAVVSTPFDVIKTRVINQHKGQQVYRGNVDCLIKTVSSEGPMALYKGFLPTWGRLGPWQWVFFLAFEQCSIALTGKTFPSR